MISLHTSPLLQPGSGDSGGMNVYVRELVSSLSQAGLECTTYTRADREGLPSEVFVEPNHKVVYIEAGPHHLPKEALPEIVDEFTDRVLEHLAANGGADAVHATTGSVASLRTASSTSSTSRSCRPSTRSPGSNRRAAIPSQGGAIVLRPN